jgi:hypothetical protein
MTAADRWVVGAALARVRFLASPCRGKQCIRSGWLAHEGDFAACLPNGVAVEVLGPERGLDAINY